MILDLIACDRPLMAEEVEVRILKNRVLQNLSYKIDIQRAGYLESMLLLTQRFMQDNRLFGYQFYKRDSEEPQEESESPDIPEPSPPPLPSEDDQGSLVVKNDLTEPDSSKSLPPPPLPSEDDHKLSDQGSLVVKKDLTESDSSKSLPPPPLPSEDDHTEPDPSKFLPSPPLPHIINELPIIVSISDPKQYSPASFLDTPQQHFIPGSPSNFVLDTTPTTDPLRVPSPINYSITDPDSPSDDSSYLDL